MPNRNIDSKTDPIGFEERKDFSGGVAYANYVGKIGDKYQQENINMDFDGVDGISTRSGYVSLAGGISLAGMSIGGYFDISNARAIVSGSGSSKSFNGTTLSSLSGYAPTGSVDMIQAGNKMYSVDGIGNMFYFDGTNWTEHKAPAVKPAPTGCSLITVVGGKIALTGKADEPGRIFFSDINLNDVPEFDQSTWSLDNGNDGNTNTAHCAWYDSYYVVFKRNSTVVIDCNALAKIASEYEISTASKTVGCVAPKTAKMVGSKKVMFVARDGIRYVYPSDSVSVRFAVSSPVSDMIRDVWGRVNMAAIDKAHAVCIGDKYILHVPLGDSSVCNAAIVWDERLNGGSGGFVGVWEGINSQASCVATIGGDERVFTVTNTGVLGASLDHVIESALGSDNFKDYGVDISSSSASGGFVLGEPFNDKRFYSGEINYRLENTQDSGSLYAAIDGEKFEQIGVLRKTSSGFTFPFTFPIYTGRSNNVTRPFSLISLGNGRCVSIKAAANSGRLKLASIWVSGAAKQIRKDNS